MYPLNELRGIIAPSHSPTILNKRTPLCHPEMGAANRKQLRCNFTSFWKIETMCDNKFFPSRSYFIRRMLYLIE